MRLYAFLFCFVIRRIEYLTYSQLTLLIKHLAMGYCLRLKPYEVLVSMKEVANLQADKLQYRPDIMLNYI